MGSYDAGTSDVVIAWVTQQANPPSVTGTKLVLGSTVPTPTGNMTQLTGTGSTPGALAWTSPSGESASNSAPVINANGSGSPWTLAGIEIWNTALTTRLLQGTPTGGSITVAPGNNVQWPVGSITFGNA